MPLVFALLWAAVSAEAVPPAARRQFADYLLAVQKLSPLERAAIDAHRRAQKKVKAGRLSDEGFAKVLDGQVIPTYQRFVARLKQVSTPSAELKRLHKMYVEGASLQLRGYRGQRAAIRAYDMGMMTRANQMVSRGNAKIEKYLKSVAALKKKYRVR